MATEETQQIPLGLTVAVVARRVGVAPATLRTWERRYGLCPSDRSEGGHRRYCVTDVARLELMRKLVLAGMSAGEAAKKALQSET
ncbi:MAG: MerR family transcriptional regulator, partial [Actinobacteria bacterium]|nr:MerR family transcriptional regulator [Actinomycetota bacterium]